MSGRIQRWTAGVSATCVTTLIAMSGCGDSATAPREETFRGPQVAVGAGMAWSEMVFDTSHELAGLSVVFTEGALSNLPPTLPATEFIIPMPSQAPATVYNHIGINWQPQGHPPPMVYTVPHFDVHFYLISMSARDAIVPADPAYVAKLLRAPTAEETPAGYSPDAMGIPRMGNHWADLSAHEFHGSPFTSTMIYGFYDGKMVFIEPMTSKAFLESKPDETIALKVPAKYPQPGRYPTNYRVAYDATTKEYRVTLQSFQTRS
ncbi:MAG: DUF5602 domain-containing protein [Gemmatimonadaceae bacterium]|nr:DUF5602 domain-containing protein [Gemmatimonadaceae bacterium]